jgi:hypothetical protein
MKIKTIFGKIVLTTILTMLLSISLYAESPSENNSNKESYELYVYEEFPDWMHKIRRAESLFIGSLPLSFGAVTLAANIFSINTSESLDKDDYLFRIGISAAVSLGVVLIDFILGELQNE